MISFLDGSSTTKYSSRAANALYASAGVSPDVFAKYHQLLFAQQPAEGSAGLTEDTLVQLAQQAGAGAVAQQIRGGTYADYVARATDQSSKDGVTGTPTVRVDGQPVAQPTLDAVTAAVPGGGRSVADRQAGVVLGQAGGAGLRWSPPSAAGTAAAGRRTGRRWRAASSSSTRRSGCTARPGAGRCRSTRRPAGSPARRSSAVSAGASRATSATARLSPLAPVGGTMCAASPARNSRPCRIGASTKLRIGSTLFSVIGPGVSCHPSWPCPSRTASSAQIRSSDQSATSVPVRHLQVEPAHRGRAHRVQREPVRVPGVDQLVGRRRARRPGSPARSTGTSAPRSAAASGIARPARPEGPVAADHDVRVQPLRRPAVHRERHVRAVGAGVVHRGVGRPRSTICWPAASRARPRSFCTSVCPYTQTPRPTRSTKSRWWRSPGHCR